MAAIDAHVALGRNVVPVLRAGSGMEQPIGPRGFPAGRVRQTGLWLLVDAAYAAVFMAAFRAPEGRTWPTAEVRYVHRLGTGGWRAWWDLEEVRCAHCSFDFDATGRDDGLPAHVCWVLLVARYWTSDVGRFDAWRGRLVPAPQAPRAALDPVTYAPTPGLRAAPGPAVPAPHSDIPPHLPAPQPQPSPDHRQVRLTQAEWQALVKGRWDRSTNRKLLKAQRQTEFQVDGTTYRTDARGKVVAVFDAHKSFNVTGARKGYPGIPLTLTGEPTFVGTPHMFPVTDPQKNVVTVDMVGNRPGDFKAANEAAGLADVVKAQGLKGNKAPKGYTWHHRDDFKPNPSPPPLGTCTMELVSAKAHRRTFVHYGACDQCNKHAGKKLYA